MVDYNQCLTPAEAVQRMRVLDDEGLRGSRSRHSRTTTPATRWSRAKPRHPIQCGENWWGPLDMQHALDAHARDYVMPDVMKIGGVTGWLRAAALAQAAGMRVSNHLWPEISAQLLSVDADGALARIRRLVEPDPCGAAGGNRWPSQLRRSDRQRHRMEWKSGRALRRLIRADTAAP